MRSNISKFMKNIIIIYRLKGTRDAFAGKDMAWGKKYWGIKCRIYTTKGAYKVEVEGKKYEVSNKLMCETDVDIRPEDKITDDCDRTFIVVRTDVLYKATVAHHIEGTLSRIEA